MLTYTTSFLIILLPLLLLTLFLGVLAEAIEKHNHRRQISEHLRHKKYHQWVEDREKQYSDAQWRAYRNSLTEDDN